MAPRNRPRTSSDKNYAHFEGLEDFLSDMGVAKRNMKAAEHVFQSLAAVTVVTEAREFGSHEGRLATRAARDVRVAGPGTVVYGGKGYSFGAEFGSYQYHQFKNWRGNQDGAGYFLWPAIRKFRDKKLLETWVNEVWSKVKVAFPD